MSMSFACLARIAFLLTLGRTIHRMARTRRRRRSPIRCKKRRVVMGAGLARAREPLSEKACRAYRNYRRMFPELRSLQFFIDVRCFFRGLSFDKFSSKWQNLKCLLWIEGNNGSFATEGNIKKHCRHYIKAAFLSAYFFHRPFK